MLRNVLIALGSLLFSVSFYGQVCVGGGSIPNSKPICGRSSGSRIISESKEESQITLQEYVEHMYEVSSLWWNEGATSSVEKGYYAVVLIYPTKDGKGEKIVLTKDLAVIKREEVEKIEYRKHKDKDGYFGKVTITLK